MRFFILFFLFGLYACNQKAGSTKHSIDPEAKKLNDSAVFIATHFNDYENAVNLLDKATQLDSNYFRAYINKFSFQGMVKPFHIEKILIILKNLNRLKPEDPEYFMQIGLIYLKNGDTVLSKQYLSDAAMHYDKILDTMQTTTEGYKMLISNKAFNLILLGEEEKGKELVRQLYIDAKDIIYKKILASALNKSRKEILDSIILK
jgi:hypothetical protein